MSARGSWSLSGVIFAVLFGVAHAGELLVREFPDDIRPELEVLAWDDDLAVPIDRRAAPARFALPAGRYALRIAGTEHRSGPFDVSATGVVEVAPGIVRIAAPIGSVNRTFYALARDGGTVAGRAVAGKGPAMIPLLPGEYYLHADLADPDPSVIVIGASEAVDVRLGALQLSAPVVVADFAYHVVADAGGRIAAHARFSEGPVPLPPGNYRLLREDSGQWFTATVEVDRTTSVAGGALEVRALDGQRRGYAVVTANGFTPVLRGTAGDAAHFLPPDPSPLLLMERTTLAKLPAAAEAALRFVTVTGRTARFWMRPDGIVAAAGEGDIIVSARATADGRVPVAVAVPATVTIAAAAEIVIALRTGGARSGDLARFMAQPPTAQTVVTLPTALAEGSQFQLEATARLPDGSTLQGRSAVYLAARGPTNAPANLRGNPRGPTVAILEWDRSRDAAAYLVTRTPAAWSGPARVVSGSRLEDLGLSGGRQYDYEVCPVDARDVPGPCSKISVRMPVR